MDAWHLGVDAPATPVHWRPYVWNMPGTALLKK